MAASFLSLSSPLLITAPPSSQRNNSLRGIASFGCTTRRGSGLGDGKLVLRCSRDDKMDVRVSAVVDDGIFVKSSDDSTVEKEVENPSLTNNVESPDDSTVKKELEKPSSTNNVESPNDPTVENEVKDLKPDPSVKKEVEKPKLSKMSTILLNVENKVGDPHLASSIPIYQTATYKQKRADEMGTYAYTRFGNPTRDMLESILAELDKADKAFCFTSGMAALTAVTHLVKAGEEIVTGEDIYGGSDELLEQLSVRTGVVVTRVDMTKLDEVKEKISSKTKLVWLESPTNPRLQISDIRKISHIARANGALTIVDNSIMSPVLSRPLELGADIVMHSATKFIAGHSDVMAGVLAVKGEELAAKLKKLQKDEGSGLSPFDCWVCLRGIKTMALRVERQQENAQKIAKFLDDCKKDGRVKNVNYPGLPNHPGYDLHRSQADGPGSVLSFTTGSVAFSKAIVQDSKYFGLTLSFGNVKSLISMPGFMSHKGIPKDVREARGLKEDLVRISVGIEDVDDLIRDLRNALQFAPIENDRSIYE